MWVWVKRLIKLALSLLAILILVVLATLYFAPISNPSVMINQIFGYSIKPPTEETIEQRLKVPEGFSIGKYATGLANV